VATTQEAVQISAIVPTLTVDDLQKSIAFYEALGFAIEDRWEEKGTLLGVMLRAGSTRIGLNQDDWKKGATERRASVCACRSRRPRVRSTRSRSGRGTPASRSSRSLTRPSGTAARSRSPIRAVTC